MAEKNSPSTVNSTTNSFNKGMVKDFNETFIGEGLWTHARNAVNNSHDGQLGVLGNEPANFECLNLTKAIIGNVAISATEWVIFSTDDLNSEIGIFDSLKCSYKKVVADKRLNFKTTHLITAVYRSKFDCNRQIYWSDGLNPDRTMDLEKPPFVINKIKQGDCYIDQVTDVLDIEKLRIAPLVEPMSFTLTSGKGSGTLLNGSYQVTGAYVINGIAVSNYATPSEVQPLWSHDNSSGALEITIDSIDPDFDEFELVIISVVNQQTVAKKLGIYSTRQKTIYIDTISPELVTVPISMIAVQTPAIEKSDALYKVNNYLIRTGVYTKVDFNYQLLANKIRTKWVAVQYPSDYYRKGGNNASYLRDEQYAFFIRWIYNTGEKSASYHIPGKASSGSDTALVLGPDGQVDTGAAKLKKWQVYNTASITSTATSTLSDGGQVLAEGEMGYWESAEKYPDNKQAIWGDLCGKPIRHHKFPDNTVSDRINHYDTGGNNITLLGVKFENIQHPVDITGAPITSIVGYEILRGSREGQKTIVAKGLFNNMRQYTVPGAGNIKGLYQNYPYNDLRPDIFHSSSKSIIDKGTPNNNTSSPLSEYKKDIFSFHSPDTNFSRPYLSSGEVKIYSEIHGTSSGSYLTPHQHPRFKQMADGVSWISQLIGAINAVNAVTKGVKIAGTEKFPIELDLTPGPLPQHPPAAGGDIAGPVTVAAAKIEYAASLVLWGLNVALIATVAARLAEVQAAKIVDLFKGLIPKEQYAVQYNSHGLYDKFIRNTEGNIRRRLQDISYVADSLQQFGSDYRINNLYRSNFVSLKLEGELNNPATLDKSRNRISDLSAELNKRVNATISGWYGAIKIPLIAQYGQIDSIKQLPVSKVFTTEADLTKRYTSDIIFGGDTYINRYTEKNAMFFFNDWLQGQPDEFEYDYRNYVNIPYPRYWIDNRDADLKLTQAPSDFRHLDFRDSATFHVRRGYFYLFYNGVRDFFCESEVNLALRDYDELPSKQHYDAYRYTDLDTMFRSDIIKSNNFYKYDYSLSVSRLYNNFTSWGNTLPRTYDPQVSSTCYSYYPNRAIYSLPQEKELLKDNWRVFLANNYYDFESKIASIYPIAKNGAMILTYESSPVQFMGVDQLQTDAGTKLTIGDGGLFKQPLQNLVNADKTLQYGGSQSRQGVLNTPAGLFWVSQKQGRIFNFSGKMDEITDNGMKYWFRKYLPSKLLEQFPDFAYQDNPVAGVGVTMGYDNTNAILYVSKKDYEVNPEYKDNITYQSGGTFLYRNALRINLTNRKYFTEISWTASYDVKNGSWISFHDWHPTMMLSGSDHLMTAKYDSVWKHNERCDQYCNFYGVNYPFEVEFVSSTGQSVSTVKSVEYIMEAYRYSDDCKNKYHLLDENFDQAMVYNSEQISGNLNLRIAPKNDPLALLNFPIVTDNGITINFSKEENKYRFNQFWDITRNRNEFNGIKNPMFLVSSNGYTNQINPLAIDYTQDPTEHKKFRHYANRVWLKKLQSNRTKMLFKVINTKVQASLR